MESPELVNQQRLAQILRYDERQIRRWHNHPDSPGRVGKLYDVEKWKAFAAAHGRKSPSERKAELEAEKLDIANQRQLFKLECEQKQWTPNTELDPALQQFTMMLVSHLEDMLERRLPRSWANKTPDQLREMGRAEYDALMVRIKSGCTQLMAQFPAPVPEEEAA